SPTELATLRPQPLFLTPIMALAALSRKTSTGPGESLELAFVADGFPSCAHSIRGRFAVRSMGRIQHCGRHPVRLGADNRLAGWLAGAALEPDLGVRCLP